ncbi:hypothetical protein SAMN05216480_106145 [Pustulibacterium marinum]|uniref:Uncharacterized protein n=1 Tax=Pustulibacterium marinum TaxID=1224947 RepID=A0A1I7H064_9FLAO|nr:hypothetical protein [Pustulibacterium marinum]SFU54050.1 hypothetical protein SAMN05216480_106145 [Pustulibacterium marinum]
MISKNYIAYNAKDKVRFRKDKKSKKVKYNENEVSKVIIRILDLKPYLYKYVQVSKKRKELFYIMTSGKVTLYGRDVQTSRPNESNVGPNYLSASEHEFYVLREGEPIASPLVTARISRSFKVRV